MKTKLLIVCALSVNVSLYSQVLLSEDWISDGYDSFDVVLNGTGPGWSGSINSPSGLWQVYSWDYVAYNTALEPSVLVGNDGAGVYLGQLPPEYPSAGQFNPNANAGGPSIHDVQSYTDVFTPGTTITDQNALSAGYLAGVGMTGYPYLDWTGMATLSITSMPDLNDASTWTWSAECSASGTSLITLSGLTFVPEPGAVSIGILGAILGIVSISCRSRKLNG